MAATWCFVLVRFDDFRQRLPALHEVLQGGSLLLMWAVIAAVKVLHELGHAFACRRFGGECHEIGVALMIFSPSMYCDVSDAGRLPSRWARMAIGAAGMYVELVLSAAAFFVWWNTRDGLLHELSWTVFFVTQRERRRLQPESAAAARRLLHAQRLAGRSESPPEGRSAARHGS